MLRLTLYENSFQFNGKNYLQIHGTAVGTKMAVAFANICMADIETEILSKSVIKPLLWKRHIDDSLWDVNCGILRFINKTNLVSQQCFAYPRYLARFQQVPLSHFQPLYLKTSPAELRREIYAL